MTRVGVTIPSHCEPAEGACGNLWGICIVLDCPIESGNDNGGNQGMTTGEPGNDPVQLRFTGQA